MKNLNAVRGSFGALESEEGLQTAVMRLEKGEESGPYGNEHANSVQILLVVSGSIDATIDCRESRLETGDSLIVIRGAQHRFVGASEEAAVTFNVYSPPAY